MENTRCGTKLDPYRVRAAKLFSVAYEAVTEAQRRYAKTYMFREIYSMKPPVKKYNDLHR